MCMTIRSHTVSVLLELQGGIMSATTGLLLKQLEPSWRIVSRLNLQACEHRLDDFLYFLRQRE